LQRAHAKIRDASAFMDTDRSLAGDIARVRELIEAGAFR
jgi:histidine ammonia-lyase